MAKHFVAVETAPGLSDTGKMFAVDPSAASGIALPSFKMVATLPRVGNIIGEGYFVTTSKTAFAWDGRIFQPVVPSAILTYPNDASVYADNTQPAGSYGASADTGHLFIMSQTGWRMVGSKTYANIAAANADTNVSDGSLGWLTAEQVMIIRVGGAWQRIVDTPHVTVSSTKPTAPITGDMAFDATTKVAEIYDGTAWQKLVVASAIIGEIKQSTLTETQFATAVGSGEANKWFICDGRSAAGTDWATITGKTSVPDLRGRFLRMAGGNASALNTFQDGATARPTTAFTGLAASAGQHAHNAGIPTWNDAQGYIYGRDTIGNGKRTSNWDTGNATANPWTSENGAHSHNVTINGGGDSETRPQNYSVNFFIKVRA